MRITHSAGLAWALSGLAILASVGPVAAQAPAVTDVQLAAQGDCVTALESYAAERARQDTSTEPRRYDAKYLALVNDGLDRIGRAIEAAPEGQALICPAFAAERGWRRRSNAADLAPPTAAQKDVTATRVQAFRRKIYGGWFVPPLALREVVAISTGSGGLCSGTLIAPDVVATAAHCFCGDGGAVQQGGFIYIGEDMADGRGRTINIRRIETTPGFCSGLKSARPRWGLDLAVAYLAQSATGQSAQIVNLSRQYLPQRPKTMAVVGFGLNEFRQSGRKMYTAVSVVSPYCGGGSPSQYGCTRGREIVLADAAQRADTCNGDSGGPVFHMEQTATGQTWYLTGITSRAASSRVNPNTDQECGYGGIYTLLGPPAIDWLCQKRGRSRFQIAGGDDACP